MSRQLTRRPKAGPASLLAARPRRQATGVLNATGSDPVDGLTLDARQIVLGRRRRSATREIIRRPVATAPWAAAPQSTAAPAAKPRRRAVAHQLAYWFGEFAVFYFSWHVVDWIRASFS
jgi:hypothetical protein